MQNVLFFLGYAILNFSQERSNLLLTTGPRWLMPRMYCSHTGLLYYPIDVPDLTASLLLWCPSSQRRRCLWTFLFSNVPTFATSRLQEILATKRGNTWAKNCRWILPENVRLPRNIQGSFTCRKSTTWDRRLYFPSEGRRAEDFSPWKIQRLRSGLNPRTWVPKATTLPLDHRCRYGQTLPRRN